MKEPVRGSEQHDAVSAESDDVVLEVFTNLARIRAAELAIQRHIKENGFGGFWHPGIGQEGVQAGAVSAMGPDDYLFYAHRGLGCVVARGMSWRHIFGDLFGRTTGSARGKGGGTIHFSDPQLGVMGQGGTLGSNFVLGAGTALASQMLGDGRVTLVFFGEGAAARGTFHEAAISAAAWKLPVVWVCENNGWALSAPYEDHNPTPDLADRAAAYGVPGIVVDGQDALAVRRVAIGAIERARRGDGPTLIEAKTIRARGHYEGDQQKYREDGVVGLSPAEDPLEILGMRIKAERRATIIAAAQQEVDAALQDALSQPEASSAVLYSDLWA
jgi:acetoin:2,6-dichlorophenolindophenol oxidoreductase subunit alpha